MQPSKHFSRDDTAVNSRGNKIWYKCLPFQNGQLIDLLIKLNHNSSVGKSAYLPYTNAWVWVLPILTKMFNLKCHKNYLLSWSSWLGRNILWIQAVDWRIQDRERQGTGSNLFYMYIFSIFMQFRGEITQNSTLTPHLGNPGSATAVMWIVDERTETTHCFIHSPTISSDSPRE